KTHHVTLRERFSWKPSGHPTARRPPTRSQPGRILVIGPPRSGTTWVEQVLGRAAGARVVHEPDNETCSPFALRAKATLGRFPVLAAGDRAPLAYFELWSRAFEGVGRAATARAQADEALAVLSAFPARLFGRASVA